MTKQLNIMDDIYESFIFKSRYARWLDTKGRRETWEESILRYFDFVYSHPQFPGSDSHIRHILSNTIEAMKSGDVVPSMRAFMTAGPALERCNMAAYNCGYIAIDKLGKFAELMYALMCGTGVGFSVERDYVKKLPQVPMTLTADDDSVLIVEDTREGWCNALHCLLSFLYTGTICKYDLSKIRPAGARLKTFGGRASGPEPLDELFKFIIETFEHAIGTQLTPIKVHDICCKIAQVVVVGGVRRSALISLSNLSDLEIANCKSDLEFARNPHRALANNSVAYTRKPDTITFINEWKNLIEHANGERGIFNRQAAVHHIKSLGRREWEYEWGTNPCSEILLRDRQLCNLSEVIIRPSDTYDHVKEKLTYATFLGTFQSLLTNFQFVNYEWKQNCEEERLLGVSLTGIMDHPFFSQANDDVARTLLELKHHAIDMNEKFSKAFGINNSTAITCVKPSGTVSQLMDTSSGIHPRYAPYYIRRVRQSVDDPITQFLKDQGVNWEDDIMQPRQVVFSFPRKAPLESVVASEVTAIQQLELWHQYAKNWCEHKPSMTVYVKDHEWLLVGAWVYANFDDMSGISFLPHSDHVYKQAPYEEIDEGKYIELMSHFPEHVDWDKLQDYEDEDNTTVSQEMACVGNVCEVE